MKKLFTLVFVVLSALTACTVQNQGQSYDDVYYNPNDKSAIIPTRSALLHKSTKEIVTKSDTIISSDSYVGNNVSNAQGYKALKDSGAYVIGNNFNYDDYYDYSYASRIRRFQYSPFNDYYHDYYTNRYWYDYNPGYWGSSIYSNWGMNFGMSYYMDPFSSSWGFYSPFSSFYDPFYYGYGYSPFGYSGFWNGYNRGYYDGYYGYGYGGYGYGGYGHGGGFSYSNSYDQNSRVNYVPRRNVSGSNGPTPNERAAFSQRYNAFSGGGSSMINANAPRNGREAMNVNASGSQVTPGLKDSKVSSTTVAGVNQREPGNGRNNLFGTSNTQRVVSTREQPARSDLNRYVADPVKTQQVNGRSSMQQQNPSFRDRVVGSQSVNPGATRYTKPQQSAAPQQYYSPANSRPRSSNEYTSPGYRNQAVYNSNQSAPQRSVSDPQRYAPPRAYQAPSTSSSSREVGSYNSYRSSGNTTPSSYSSPSRNSYSAPTQSYSAPAQSYSAPTQSYSAPAGNARESGSSSSSSGSSSSGSSSQGPRR